MNPFRDALCGSVQPLNYCRQIAREAQHALAIPSTPEVNKAQSRHVLDLVAASQKIILGGNGILLAHGMNAIDQTLQIKLPYPFIAIELNLGEMSSIPGVWVRYKKRVIFAREHADQIVLTMALWDSSDGTWRLMRDCSMPKVGAIEESASGPEVLAVPSLTKDDAPYIRLDAASLDDAENYSIFAQVLLGLIVALTCSNVRVEQLARPRSKRVKSALQFDTYHILTVDVSPRGIDGHLLGGTHRSPREHLRRGHFRTYASGLRIWINNVVVNAGSGGKVTKDYFIRNSAGTQQEMQ